LKVLKPRAGSFLKEFAFAMHDIYLSTVIFHALATVGFFGFCAWSAVQTPARRPPRLYRPIVSVPDRSTPMLDAYERKLALEAGTDADEANVA
jgi:hypothetical protein